MNKVFSKYELSVLESSVNYIETFFDIKSKDRKVVPFRLNEVQRDYMAYRSGFSGGTRGQRDFIVKGRQHGFTTLKAAEYLHQSLTEEGTTSVIVGHDKEAMQKLLSNVRVMYNSVPSDMRPEIGYDNKGEITFPDMNSSIYITTYRQLSLRSQTVHNLLMTEVAFWKDKSIKELVAGMTEAVPYDGNIAVESTPNGLGGYYWDQYRDIKDGNSIYKLFLYPWFVNKLYQIDKSQWGKLPKSILPVKKKFDHDEMESVLVVKYRLTEEQLMWRRFKMLSMGDMRWNGKSRVSRMFAQEYECDFIQSGHTVFDSAYLVPKTTFRRAEKGRKYIHGGDTAEGVEGGDYNVLYTMDFETGEIVNKIRGLWKPREFAIRIHRIALDYGGLVGIESNNTGHAVLGKLSELFEEEAVARSKKSGKKLYSEMPYRIYSEKKRLGWQTNELNRKTLFVEGEEALRYGNIKMAIEDEDGLAEFIACQYNDKMKEEAPVGMHDDCVLAMLICWQMRKYYQFYFRKGSQVKTTTY
jgi:hypothetical protein